MTHVTTIMCDPAVERAIDTLCGLQENQAVLRQAIRHALHSLGGPIAETITWQLRARGMLLESEIDVQRFYQYLGQTVGAGVNMVMIEVCEHAMRLAEKMNPTANHRIHRGPFEDALGTMGARGRKAIMDDLQSRGACRDGRYLELADVCESLGRYFDATSPDIAVSRVWTKVNKMCAEGALMATGPMAPA
jgi:hypothetical protein